MWKEEVQWHPQRAAFDLGRIYPIAEQPWYWYMTTQTEIYFNANILILLNFTIICIILYLQTFFSL